MVISDTNFLKSLPKREIICGYAEILKHSIIKDKKFFNWLKKNNISDKEIEENHDFIQIVFPLNKPSQSVLHGYYLDSQDIVVQIKNNKEATNNIIKSSQWFFSFLKRNMYWNDQHDHNQLRITRVIECLRLLVSG